MKYNWKKYTVQELIDMKMLYEPMDGNHGGIHPKTSDYVKTGVPFIMANNLIDGEVDLDNCAFISETQAKTLKKGFALPDDVLLTHKATIGRTAIVPNKFKTIILTPQITYYRVKNGIDNRYLKYYFDSPYFQTVFSNWAGSGSTRAYLGITAQHKLPIILPSIEEQKVIADLLGSLDKKIRINRIINKNLSKQISTLCNAWLSDYEPFGGSTPSDWVATPLSDIAIFTSGYSYKGNELQASNTAMATIKNFDRKGGFKLDGYKEVTPSSKLKAKQHASLFDTLVAHTDLTQNAEVIGNAEPILSFSGYNDIIFSMDLVKVLPSKSEISKFLIAALLQDRRFKEHCLGYVNGTTVLHLSKKALPEYTLMMPADLSVLKPLDEAVSVMYMQMAHNIDESVRLADLRDNLLPKLMSGEIDVSDLRI